MARCPAMGQMEGQRLRAAVAVAGPLPVPAPIRVTATRRWGSSHRCSTLFPGESGRKVPVKPSRCDSDAPVGSQRRDRDAPPTRQRRAALGAGGGAKGSARLCAWSASARSHVRSNGVPARRCRNRCALARDMPAVRAACVTLPVASSVARKSRCLSGVQRARSVEAGAAGAGGWGVGCWSIYEDRPEDFLHWKGDLGRTVGQLWGRRPTIADAARYKIIRQETPHLRAFAGRSKINLRAFIFNHRPPWFSLS